MISIIIPFYNEESSLSLLCQKIIAVMEKEQLDFELIFVNDGSTDSPSLKINNNHVKIISHRKRLGKGKALLTGFENSVGDIIAFIDADLQNDPQDLPRLIKKINDGYDFVNGWRKYRKDPLAKTLPSSIFNLILLKVFLQSKIHDVNCGLKIMRRSVLENIPLYGDNYRFLPIIAQGEGFKTTEVIVSHYERKYGKSKYGIFRLFFGLWDTLTTYFIYKFSEKPLHFFGTIGSAFFLIGFIYALILSIQRLFFGVLLYRRPALLLAILLIIVGIQIIMTGIIGELIVYLKKRK